MIARRTESRDSLLRLPDEVERAQHSPELSSIPPAQRAEHDEYQEDGGGKQDIAPDAFAKEGQSRFGEVLGPALKVDTALGTRCRRSRNGAPTARARDRAGTSHRGAALWRLTSAIFEGNDWGGHGRWTFTSRIGQCSARAQRMPDRRLPQPDGVATREGSVHSSCDDPRVDAKVPVSCALRYAAAL